MSTLVQSLKPPSLVKRIAIGKLVGLAFGLIGFFSRPLFAPTPDVMLQVGVLLWYPTVGAVIGVFGVFTWHPILHLPMPWWFRAPLIGGWMNFVLVFFAYDSMQTVMTAMFGAEGYLTSPFWFTLEGAVIGLIIGWLATRFGGEGKETMAQMR